MKTLYVAAPGRSIPGGWPEGGRAIDETSRLHRRFVRDGDLVASKKTQGKRAVKPAQKKETNHGE
jgi:hypothetical protein